MALTYEQNKELEELFRNKLQEQYNRGIRVGVMTVSKIVTDKLNDKSIPFMQRIEDVKRFCKIAPSVEQKYDEIAGETVNSEDQEQVSDDNSENHGNPESEPPTTP